MFLHTLEKFAMPKGYIIGEIEVTNLAGYETYRSQSPKLAEQFGGRYPC
ncbi:MAG: DUF1330 domain-containing protein [Rhodobacteraceae bacterium]|nr:DUF1330 domain-containing protein [Paracoccaceae bacterium]